MRYEGEERRRAQSFPEGRSYPLWAQLIRDFGFPIVVSMILLGMLTGYVPNPISRTEAMIEKHVTAEGERTSLIRTLCYHQAVANHQPVEDCLNGRSHR